MTRAQAAEKVAEALRSISAEAVRAYRDPESVTIPLSDLEDARAALAAYEASAEQGTAMAGEVVRGVLRRKMGNGARYVELDDHPHLAKQPRLSQKYGNGCVVEVRATAGTPGKET